MACQEYSLLLMGYADGELDEGERPRIEEHLAGCPDCAAEVKRYEELTEMTRRVQFVEPTDVEWARFWDSVFNRLERGAGWIFVILGAILILSYGIYGLIVSPDISLLPKIAILTLGIGFALLFLSVLRGRLRVRKVDRYRRIQR